MGGGQGGQVAVHGAVGRQPGGAGLAISNVLLDLAAMEDDHEKTFAAMRAELPAGEQVPPALDPDGEAQMYLRVMADSHVFDVKADPTEHLADGDDAAEVLKMAIGLEKDSIAFYVGLKEAVSRRAGKDKTLINLVIKKAFERVGCYYYYFPTGTKGRQTIWDGIDRDGFPFLSHIPKEIITKKNDQEMKIQFRNGSIFQVIGTLNVITICHPPA